MCGVPVERSDDYLQRLIGLGHRVAVCEQTEDPAEAKKRGSKSVVRREVVRLVTPGTITEDRLLDPGRANVLLALARRRASDSAWCYGLAAVDISTGRFSHGEVDGAGLAAEIARLDPREIVMATPSTRIPTSPACGATPGPPSPRSAAATSIRLGRAGLEGAVRRPDPRRLRDVQPGRGRGGGRGAALHRPHPARRQGDLEPAGPPGGGREPDDRCGDAPEPRTHPHPLGRAPGQPARRHRPHRRRRRRAAPRPSGSPVPRPTSR